MKKNKRIVIPLTLLIIFSGAFFSGNIFDTVKPLYMAQLIAFGMLLGILLVSIINWNKEK